MVLHYVEDQQTSISLFQVCCFCSKTYFSILWIHKIITYGDDIALKTSNEKNCGFKPTSTMSW